MSHTTGPWRFVEGEFNNDESRANAIGSVRGGIEGGWFIATVENAPGAAGNAYLLAAAPHMLRALKRADKLLEKAYGETGTLDATHAVYRDMQAVKDAIRKAEGRS